MTRRLLSLLFAFCLPSSLAAEVVVAQQRLLAVRDAWNGSAWQLRAASVDFDGNDEQLLLLSDARPYQTAFDAATDGEQFLIVWTERESIRAAIGGRSPVTITESASTETRPVVIWSGTHYLAFWRSPIRTHLALITPEGIVESTRILAGVGTVEAAGTGPRPVVLWIDRTSTYTLRAAFLDAAWNAGDPVTIATTPSDGRTFLYGPQIAWNGSEYYVTWITSRKAQYAQIEGTRLTLDGALVDGRVIYNGFISSFLDGALQPFGWRIFKSWVGSSQRSSHHLQGSWIEPDGSSSAPSGLRAPIFPPVYGDVIVLPNGTLAEVRVIANHIVIERLDAARRRAVR